MATIQRALETATIVVTGDRVEYENEVQRLTAARESLLPVEKAAKAEIEELIQVASARAQAIAIAEELGGGKILSQEIFSWTKTQQVRKEEAVLGLFNAQRTHKITVPALAFLPLDEESLRLSVDVEGSVWLNDDTGSRYVPFEVQARYQELLRLNKDILSGRQRLVLTYSYAGVLPTYVKDIIASEMSEPSISEFSGRRVGPKPKRFDSLALVCDVDRWSTTWETPSPPREYFDPILVGVKNSILWVLAAFDPTPLEEYLASEFTS